MDTDVEVCQCSFDFETAGTDPSILAGGLFRPLFEKCRSIFRKGVICGGQSSSGGTGEQIGGLAISGVYSFPDVLDGAGTPSSRSSLLPDGGVAPPKRGGEEYIAQNGCFWAFFRLFLVVLPLLGPLGTQKIFIQTEYYVLQARIAGL